MTGAGTKISAQRHMKSAGVGRWIHSLDHKGGHWLGWGKFRFAKQSAIQHLSRTASHRKTLHLGFLDSVRGLKVNRSMEEGLVH